MYDIVIRGGTVVDGSGEDRTSADVAIDGETIVAVGESLGPGRREIDADGALVTPGWVDMHTHYDAQATWDPDLTPSGWHGVTSVVVGNCGVGFAPVAPDRHDWLIGLMEGVEDIPGAALTDGMQWGWESFPEYLDVLDEMSWVMDVGTQMPHGALRAYVMGDRGAANETSTPEDIARMARLTTEALRAGALGFTTSRTPLHKSSDGVLVPGTTAERDELLGIASGMAEAGHGVFQCAIHHPDLPASFAWFRDVAALTGKPVTFNFVQSDAVPTMWQDVLLQLEQAAADGLEIWGQCTGRPIGILQGWHSTVHPFIAHPSWREISQLEGPARIAELRKPEVRARLLSEQPDGTSRLTQFIIASWHKLFPMNGTVNYEPTADLSVEAMAARAHEDPYAFVYDHMLGEDGNGLLWFPLFNYTNGNLDALREMHAHPRTRMGLADAGAHCATICDGAMPTFMLSFWGRDRTRGEGLPLEHLVQRQTRGTAEHYGLLDRGLIQPGYRADINVIDFDSLSLDAPKMAWDLPTGAPRFVQRGGGYLATMCRGAVVADNGSFTGERPGRLIRGPQAIDPGGANI